VSRTVHIGLQARRDIRANHDWLRRRSQAAADRWLASLDRAVRALADTAEQYPRSEVVVEGHDLREMLHGRRRAVYRVFFEFSADRVDVVRVPHASQGDPDPADFPPGG
jgi:plasmid stabilization system protein ParE